jgi:hypothetical protein
MCLRVPVNACRSLANGSPECLPHHAYPPQGVRPSLGTGIRTEEARALLWEHVDPGDPDATPPRPASIAVWRSVRAHGDSKTPSSRRTLGLPATVTTSSLVSALRLAQPVGAGVACPVSAVGSGSSGPGVASGVSVAATSQSVELRPVLRL